MFVLVLHKYPMEAYNILFVISILWYKDVLLWYMEVDLAILNLVFDKESLIDVILLGYIPLGGFYRER